MPGVTIKFTRFDDFAKALRRKRTLLSRVELEAARSAAQVQATARITLQRGSRSGIIYRKKSGKTHQASAPGEPLKSDTGNLASHVFARVGKGFAEVGTAVRYGKYWEEDAPANKRRPWLGPSFLKHKDAILRRMKAAVSGAMKG